MLNMVMFSIAKNGGFRFFAEESVLLYNYTEI